MALNWRWRIFILTLVLLYCQNGQANLVEQNEVTGQEAPCNLEAPMRLDMCDVTDEPHGDGLATSAVDKAEVRDGEKQLLLTSVPDGTMCLVDLTNGDVDVVTCEDGQWKTELQSRGHTSAVKREKRFFFIFLILCIIFCRHSSKPPNKNPTIVCPNIPSTIYTDKGFVTKSVTWNKPSMNDPDGPNKDLQLTQTGGLRSGETFREGSHYVSYSVKDVRGGTARCTKHFYVRVHRCPDTYTFLANGEVTCTPSENKNIYGSRCQYSCKPGYKLVGADFLECESTEKWSEDKPTCEVLSCTKQPDVDNGKFDCPNGHKYQDSCSLTCDKGYQVEGSPTITCTADSRWTTAGWCRDVEPPVFVETCPLYLNFPAGKLGESTYVSYEMPEAQDNSGDPPVVTGNPPSGSAFETGITNITVTATVGGLNATCTIVVQVTAEECDAPTSAVASNIQVLSDNIMCPDHYPYGSRCDVSCKDGNPIQGAGVIFCDKDNGTLVWTWSGNVEPHCDANACPKLPSPSNGALVCDNVGGIEICGTLCDDRFVYPANQPQTFTCVNGQWSNKSPVGCEGERDPDEPYTLPTFVYYTNTCQSDSVELKMKFIEMIKTSDFFFKDSCCDIDSISITCTQSRRQKRSPESEPPFDSLFEMKIKIVLPLGSYQKENTSEETYQYYQNLVKSINDGFETQLIEGSLSSPELGTFINFYGGRTEFQCEPGTVINAGAMSCVSCSLGYMYDNSTKSCTMCPSGTYQDKQIAFACTPCPEGKSTLIKGAQSENDCMALCSPGEWSETGNAPCRTCPAGTYQSKSAMTSCDTCPFGTSTTSPGSTSSADCQLLNLRLSESSAGPGISVVPGMQSFTVLGWLHDTTASPDVALDFSLSLVAFETHRAYISLADVALVIQQDISETRRMVRKWYHVAVSYTNGALNLYVNGKLTRTYGGQLFLSDLSFTTLAFTASQNLSSITVSGLQMTDRALSDFEVWEFSLSCHKTVESNLFFFHRLEKPIVSPSTCDDSNSCAEDPCGDFGTCIDGSGDDFTCQCQGLWSGDRCQVPFDHCADHMCENGATCVNKPESQTFSCVCEPGFKGMLCADVIQKGAWTQWTPCSVTCGGGVLTRTRLCDESITDKVEGECGKEETISCNIHGCPECKPLDLRGGHWRCTEDKEEALQTCELNCPPGLVLEPPGETTTFQCGRDTGYIWSHQSKNNPVGLLPACTPQKIPQAVQPQLSVSYDVDCAKPSPADSLKESIQDRIASLPCSVDGVCNQKISAVSSCTSRKRSTGSIVMIVSMDVNNLDSQSQNMGNTSEQASVNITETLQSVENSLVHMVNNSDEFFQVTGEDGEVFSGKLDEALVQVACPDGSGFEEGYCFDCPAGSYALGNGSCELCEQGSYQDQARQTSCLLCPGGTTTSGVGSFSVAHCMADPPTFEDITPEYIDVNELVKEEEIEVPIEKGEWSAWSQCSKTCGVGVSKRRRVCDASVTDRLEAECDIEETVGCNSQKCPVKSDESGGQSIKPQYSIWILMWIYLFLLNGLRMYM